MGIFDAISKLKGKQENIDNAIEKSGFEETECLKECESCSIKYPKLRSIDNNTPLWGTASASLIHFIIATGKIDWNAKMTGEDEDDTFALALEKYKFKSIKNNDSKKVSYSSLTPYIDNVNGDDSKNAVTGKKKYNLIIMPYFIQLEGITVDSIFEIDKLLETLNKLIKNDDGDDENKKVVNLPDNGYSFKVSPVPHKAIILLCSHKTRDRNCGITAPLLKKAFEIVLREHELLRDPTDFRPNGVSIVYVSHVGGHKFAGNVIIYRKSGELIWFGRVKPNNAAPIIEQSILQNKVWPDMLRTITKYNKIEW